MEAIETGLCSHPEKPKSIRKLTEQVPQILQRSFYQKQTANITTKKKSLLIDKFGSNLTSQGNINGHHEEQSQNHTESRVRKIKVTGYE